MKTKLLQILAFFLPITMFFSQDTFLWRIENPKNSQNKILLYSIKNINALDTLKEYSPSGNFKTAQAELPGEIEAVSQKYLEDLEKKIKNVIR